MATLTEETEQDKIEIIKPFNMLQIRTATIIKKNGVEISRSFHRHVVAPDADVSGESDDVKALAAQFHTDAIKTAYAAHLAASSPA
jgi:hypothetical protein